MEKNPNILIFCDSSFDPNSKTGTGGILFSSSIELASRIQVSDLRVETKLFTHMTNTRLELITVLWALDIFKKKYHKEKRESSHYPHTIIYTDCKTVFELPSRRNHLQKVSFKSKRTGKPLSNADLYQKFYLLYDAIKPEIFWLKGHCPTRDHNAIQSLFFHVDKTTRAKLREFKVSVI